MIIFLYGADTFRSRRFLKKLKNKFIREVDTNAGSLSQLNGEVINLKDIGEKINIGSLFVKKRLVIIENIFNNKSEKIFRELPNYLKKITDDEANIIIFREKELNLKSKFLKTNHKKLFTFLVKQPYSQKFSPLNNSQLLTYLKKEAKTYDREIETTAATLLINLSSNNLWLITKALKKLAFHSNKKIIQSEEIKEMVAGSYDENIFELTDALSNKNKKLAITLLEKQYAAGSSQEYLITMLIRQFKILLRIREALNQKIAPAKIANQLKLHPFVVKKGSIQAENFDSSTLKNYLNRLINLDFLNKTGQGNIKTELTLLISGL